MDTKSKNNQKIFLAALFCLLCLLPLLWPLVQPGFFATDDGNWMVIRLASFYQSLRGGQFPTRFLWTLNHGYGYPVTNFLYPLPFYLGSLLHLLHLSFVDSVKTIFGLSFIAGGLGMFLYGWQKMKNAPLSLSAAIIYTYFPYRVFDIYTRGSLGEAVAFAFVPFIFYGLDLVKQKSRLGLVVSALAVFGVVTSHNSLGLLFVTFSVTKILFYYWQIKDGKQLILSMAAILTGIGLAGFFIIPALLELSFTRASVINVSTPGDYFLTAQNFLPILGVGSLALIPIIWNWLQVRKLSGEQLFYLSAAVVALFLASPLSSWFWQMNSFTHLFQFPWRLISLVALVAGLLVVNLNSKSKGLNIILAIVCLVLILAFVQSASKITTTSYPDSFYSTNDDTTTVQNEYMPKWVVKNPSQLPVSPYTILHGQGSVQQNNLTLLTYATIQANIVYYPGIKILANTSTVNYSYPQGLPIFNLPPGKYVLKTAFTETPLRLLADALSLLSLGVLVGFVLSLKSSHAKS